MRTSVIAVVGSKRSGKTTTVEALVKELSSRGYRIATVKHISEQNFTMDTKGKDTWRYAQAGARTIIGIAPEEIATIEKVSRSLSLKEILRRCKGHDIILLEGFKKLVSKKKSISKIVAVKSAEEALQAVKDFKPILAFTGLCSTETLNVKAPYVDVLRHPKRIADIVENSLKRDKRERRTKAA
ncbi:molybdopterin-guanine dinucleotide biosynthesis protein B [Candidatus Bathyarchaeota archaeon]|nr:molybdopterin-guanine dinucleotide biosynthesis protein B [Candidatus Bathyarchaeota archaeon]